MSDIERIHQNLRDAYSSFLDLKKAYEKSDLSRNLDKIAEAMKALENLQRQQQEEGRKRQQEMENMKRDYEKQIRDLQEQRK